VRLNAFAALVIREWRTSWADRLAHGVRAGYAALLLVGVIAVWVTLPLLYSANSETFPDRVRAIFNVFCRVQFGLATLVATILFARAICREQERGTMDLLILCPLTRTEILLGKLVGEFLGLTALVASGIPVMFLLLPLGGLSASQILTLQTVLLAHLMVVGGICVALASLLGRTFPVMTGAWGIGAALWVAPWAGGRLFPRFAATWDACETFSTFAILNRQLGRTFADPVVALKALGISTMAGILLCGLGSLVLERRLVRGPRIGPIARLALRLRRFAATVRGKPWFRPLVRLDHPLLQRELSLDRDLAFRLIWVGLIVIYAVAFRIILSRPWEKGDYHLALSMGALCAAAVVAAVEGALKVGVERRRGLLQTLLAAGISPEDIVRSRFAGVLFRTIALMAIPAAHLVWIGSTTHLLPREELPWRIPIAVVGLIFGVLGLSQTTLRIALSSPRPEIAAAMGAILAIPIVAGVACLTGLTLGTFAIAVPIWIGTALFSHARMVTKLPRWLFR